MGECGSAKRTLVIVTHGVSTQEPLPTSDTRGLVAALQTENLVGPANEARLCLPIREAARAGLSSHGLPRDDALRTHVAVQGCRLEPDETEFDTFLLTTQSLQESQREVVFLDAYWSDLSKVSNFFLDLIIQLYRLIFHLGALGKETLADALGADRRRTWGYGLYSVGEALMAVWIPIFNLCLAAAIAVLLVAGLCESQAIVAYWVGAIGGAAAIYGTGSWLGKGRRWTWSGVAAWTGLVIVLAVGGVDSENWGRVGSARLTLLAAIGVVIAVSFWLAKQRKPSINLGHAQPLATAAGLGLLLIALLPQLVLVSGKQSDSASMVVSGALGAVDLLLLGLHLCWISFWLASVGFGLPVLMGRSKPAYITALAGLFIPSALLAGVTMLLWLIAYWAVPLTAVGAVEYLRPERVAAIFSGVSDLVSTPQWFAGFWFELIGKSGVSPESNSISVSEYLRCLLMNNLDGALLVWLGVFLLVPISLLGGLLPSIRFEIKPWQGGRNGDEKNKVSELLTKTVDCAYSLTGASLAVLVLVFSVVVPVLMFTCLITPLDPREITLGAGAGAVLLTLVKKLGGNILDRMVDVDNWLRRYPAHRTPRGLILLRMWAVLKYAADGKNGFDRIVVVSYSQGTMIWVDLLRYLKAAEVPAGSEMPAIDLFTFGSPLRQLYRARFPDLYGWVSDTLELAQLWATRSWNNAYRPGDYVGRKIWGATPDGIAQQELEPGAHCHYLTPDAADVARLVGEKLGARLPPAATA